LEAKDINGNYVASIMDINNEQVIASGSMTNYTSFTSSGFENCDGTINFCDGETKTPAGVSVVTNSTNYGAPHTGDYMLELDIGAEVEIYKMDLANDDIYTGGTAGQTYFASMWIETNSPILNNFTVQIDGGAKTPPTKIADGANGWALYGLAFDISNINSTVLFRIYSSFLATEKPVFDDFRVHPIDAGMTSNVYDQHTGQLRFILDKDNFFTEYEYDDAGRLQATYKENSTGRHLMKKYKYNYAGN